MGCVIPISCQDVVGIGSAVSVDVIAMSGKETSATVIGHIFLCDENSAPDIARSICNAKKDGVIDAFFYTSVSSTYLLDALDAL